MTTTMEGQTTTMRSRVKAAADEVEELEETLRVARERRDSVIVEALETGAGSEREIARWARLAQSSVHRILANS